MKIFIEIAADRRALSGATAGSSADQQKVEQDRGDAAGDRDPEQDDAADLIDAVHVVTDAVGEIVRGQGCLRRLPSADNRSGRLSVSGRGASYDIRLIPSGWQMSTSLKRRAGWLIRWPL